jgi:uncharacterized DUF497 family protein
MRYHAIGYAARQLLAVVIYTDESEGDEERIHIVSTRKTEGSRGSR